MLKQLSVFLFLPLLAYGMETRETAAHVMRGFEPESISPAEYRARLQFCASLLKRMHSVAHDCHELCQASVKLAECERVMAHMSTNINLSYDRQNSRWTLRDMFGLEEAEELSQLLDFAGALARTSCSACERSRRFECHIRPLFERFGQNPSFNAALCIGKNEILCANHQAILQRVTMNLRTLRAHQNPLVSFDFDGADFSLEPVAPHTLADKTEFIRSYVQGVNEQLVPFIEPLCMFLTSLRKYYVNIKQQQDAHALVELATMSEDDQLRADLQRAREQYKAVRKNIKNVYAAIRAELEREIRREGSGSSAQNLRDIFAASDSLVLPEKI